ncbi:MAG: hypothetical protein JSS02_02830 [Planctomycetes bacterium]|nr:hypothetical protein [Planctomycetota bacterium]
MRVTLNIERDVQAEWKPGATVLAKIHCGRRPLGYVWLHDVYDFIKSRVLF